MELKAIQLTKQYGSKTAVNHLNLSLSNGVYGLLGANGAGKTTLMRLLCDIQTPTSGKITLDGKNISVLGEKYRNLLGYLPQQFGYYPDFTAWDFLMYVAALKGLSEKQAHKKATELLEAVDLAEKRNLKIKTFSGGMKQRLGIAQAMLNNPRILILDEPTAGLDPKERVRFRNLISAFSKDRIVILSTHIVSDVEFIAEDIIMMKDGQILHFGKTQEITTEIDGQVWECTVPTSRAEQYSETLNISNLRNIENNCTVLRVISEQSPMENAIKVEPTLEDLYKGYNELSSVCIEARKRNIILVSAYKNNEQASCMSYPAGYMETIGVGYDKTMQKNICIYSNNIFFPTNCVFIPNKEKIELGTGSSFLTACVTGIIANHKKRNYECIMKYFKNKLEPETLLNKSQLDLHTILKGKRYCYISNKKNDTDVLQEKFYSRLTSGNIINFESNYFMNEIDKADIVILGVEPKWTGNNEIFQMVTYFASQGKDIIMPFPYINASERYKIASAYKVRIISLYV